MNNVINNIQNKPVIGMNLMEWFKILKIREFKMRFLSPLWMNKTTLKSVSPRLSILIWIRRAAIHMPKWKRKMRPPSYIRNYLKIRASGSRGIVSSRNEKNNWLSRNQMFVSKTIHTINIIQNEQLHLEMCICACNND